VYNNCAAQIQQAWVAHYNNGITNGTNQAVKMALDAAGNIYVTGFSQNATTNLGYATIKYAPNGNQLWAARYDSTNTPTAAPAASIVDASNNVIVTGSAVTVKYDANGNQLWTAPYAGTGMAGDSSGDAYVTGFGTNFNTVKLAPTGSNMWLTTYKDVGPTVGQAVVVDSNGNAYVSGSDTFQYYGLGPATFAAVKLLIIKYDLQGNRAWLVQYQDQTPTAVQVEGVAIDGAGCPIVTFGWEPSTLGTYGLHGIRQVMAEANHEL
jgi:alpha-tubulin suppressor-like RCC1 family protein